MSYSRNLKECSYLVSDLWCIGINNTTASLEATTQQGTRYYILPLKRMY